MKKLKSFFIFCLVLTILFTNTISCFAYETDYAFLLNHGFSKDFLDSLTDEILSGMRTSIGNDEVVSINTETVYLSENVTDNLQARGTISEDSLKLNISAATICKQNTSTITRVLVAITWEWYNKKPYVKKEDAIAVNWNSDIFYFHADSFVSMDLYKIFESSEWEIYNEYSSPKELNQGGLGFLTKLFNDSSPLPMYIGGQAMFLLNPTEPMYIGNTHGTGVNVNYVHNRSILPMSISFVYEGFGIEIDPSREAFDSIAKSCDIEFSR